MKQTVDVSQSTQGKKYLTQWANALIHKKKLTTIFKKI